MVDYGRFLLFGLTYSFFFSFAAVGVVTATAQRLAWLLVFIMNLVFVYFSLLRCMTRSQGWQNQFIIACVIQLFIEVFLFEVSPVYQKVSSLFVLNVVFF